jgi:hypothetical protein
MVCVGMWHLAIWCTWWWSSIKLEVECNCGLLFICFQCLTMHDQVWRLSSYKHFSLDSQSPCSSDFHRRISAKHQAMCKTNKLKSADHVHQVVLHYFVSQPSSSTGLSHLHLPCLVTYLYLNSTSKFQIEVTLLDALVPQTSMTITSSILTSR